MFYNQNALIRALKTKLHINTAISCYFLLTNHPLSHLLPTCPPPLPLARNGRRLSYRQ